MSDFNFNEIDAAATYNTVIRSLEKAVNEPLYPGDERRIFGEGLSAAFVALLNTMDDTAKQKMLKYSRGLVLDAQGTRTDTPRAEAAPAKTVLRFSVSAPQPDNIVIPAGTRATPDGSLYFATDAAAVLTAGTAYVDVPATCAQAGSAHNGYGPDTLTTLVDMLPFISVTNLAETYSGDDGEPYDTVGDDKYRERIRLSPSKRSTAGPSGAYEYYALSADPGIISVACVTPEPGVVTVVPLMRGGEPPDDTVIQKVYDILSADKVRPMTDLVMVEKPVLIPYDVEICYYTTAVNEAATIQTVEGENRAIARYNAWQTGALGRDINPDQLRRFILAPDWTENLTGAIRVDVIKPVFTEIDKVSVAEFSGKVKVSHLVVEG